MKTTTGTMRAIPEQVMNEIASSDSDYMMPSFEVPIKSIPEAENWEVGKEYNLEIKVKQKRISEENGQKMVKFCVKKLKAII